MSEKKHVVVIGAGAAGLMAAGKAAMKGHNVTLLEKNKIIGKKILISGKGRCNITNNTDIEGLIENTPGNGNFLYSSFYTFSNIDLINFFKALGLNTKVERGGRVFPISDKSKDVVNALNKFILKNNVKLRLNSEVTRITAKDNTVKSVVLKNSEEILCDKIILTTGGASYPLTGSTGDGYKMAKELGHTIKELKASLVPLVTKEHFIKDLQGISLKNIAIKFLFKNKKVLYSDFGEMLFTHFGVSGPLILSGSRHLLDHDYKDITLHIDLKPALTLEKLDLRIQRDFKENINKQVKNSLDELLPKKLIPVMLNTWGIPKDKFVNQVTKEERLKLVNILKDFKLEILKARPIEEAIVTAGGISTNEINPSTMESKIIKNLFFAGEVIDVDAYTGGFNLTIAFSTGYLAGASC